MCLNFTSGSTGTPKGIMLTHCNLASALYHQAQHLQFTKESRVYDFSSYSFGASLSQTFTSLAAGACLCVPREQDRINNLAQSITSLRANVVTITPSVAQLLGPRDVPTVQSVIFIGEPLHLRDVTRWWGQVRVLNVYGPSECTPVLAIDPALVGLEDSFFRLGGDSIGAMRVVSEEKADIELTVSQIFQYPTLGNLVSLCHHVADKAPGHIPPFALLRGSFNKKLLLREIAAQYQLDATIIDDAYPCTALQEGLLSLSLKLPGAYMIQRTLELHPTVQTADFCREWEEIARNTAILRTRIVQCSDVGPLQLVLNEGIQWVHTIGLNEYLEEDKKRPMEVGKPLARYAIVIDNTGAGS
ncbi:hypothetical protein N7527_001389 [Penicillium freii]|nr:hypothetical protein N7527_001389 [Penicillium freii]